MNSEPHNTERLAKLIAYKLRLLEQIREVTRLHSALFVEGDMKRIGSALATNSKLLKELQDTEKKLTPFRDQDPDARIWSSQEARAACRRDAERCEMLLEEVKLDSRQFEQDLMQKRDQTADRIDAAHNAAQARSAYAGNTTKQNRLDLTSD